MKILKLTKDHLTEINDLLKADGWADTYKKKLVEMVRLDEDLSSTDEFSINGKLFEDSDGGQEFELMNCEGTGFELCSDGSAAFEVRMYRYDELVDWRTVHVKNGVNKDVIFSLNEISDTDVETNTSGLEATSGAVASEKEGFFNRWPLLGFGFVVGGIGALFNMQALIGIGGIMVIIGIFKDS